MVKSPQEIAWEAVDRQDRVIGIVLAKTRKDAIAKVQLSYWYHNKNKPLFRIKIKGDQK